MFYRLRQTFHQWYFRQRTRKIHATPPLPCDPDAACSVHTMLSKRDLPMYLPAIKSFLHQYSNVAVVVHSDGSLDAEATATVEKHVLGIQVINAKQADERARQTLGGDSYLFKRRNHDASWRRLVDTELWCKTPKRIILDSDVIVLRRPDEVIRWIEQGKGAMLFGQPPDGPPPPDGQKHVQSLFRENVSKVAQKVGLPDRFPQGTTAGFYGCERELPLDRVEQVLRACEEVGLPMGQWGADQCCVIYLLEASGAMRLSPKHYLNFDPGVMPLVPEAHVLHFYGTYRYYKHLYTRLAATMAADLLAGR